MADNLSIGSNHQLYHSLMINNNTDNTLQAWMRHILVYLTAANNTSLFDVQEPHLQQNEVCDGSCDCSSNFWTGESPYEDYYQKLLMSRINSGDTNRVNSIDDESLRREAVQIVTSVNETGAENEEEGEQEVDEQMEVDSVISSDDSQTDWEFLMYDSDVESTESDLSDPTYVPSDNDLLKLDDEYSSESCCYSPIYERIARIRRDALDDECTIASTDSEYSDGSEYYSNDSYERLSQNEWDVESN